MHSVTMLAAFDASTSAAVVVVAPEAETGTNDVGCRHVGGSRGSRRDAERSCAFGRTVAWRGRTETWRDEIAPGDAAIQYSGWCADEDNSEYHPRAGE